MMTDTVADTGVKVMVRVTIHLVTSEKNLPVSYTVQQACCEFSFLQN